MIWPKLYPGESEAHYDARIRRGYRDLPETYHLFQIQWELWGMLSYRWAEKSARRCLKDFESWLQRVTRIANRRAGRPENQTHFKNVLWVCRIESGTDPNLAHLHFLISRFPRVPNLAAFLPEMDRLWRDVFRGGKCGTDPYKPDFTLGGEGCGYVGKCPSRPLATLDIPSELTFSESTRKYLLKRVSRETVA